jgi:formiminoglutamase
MFKPFDQKLLPHKDDPQDPRLEGCLKTNLNSPLQVSLLGYPDDEGIRLNGGRPGASSAPDVIRSFFYKMTPWFSANEQAIAINDLGNLDTQTLNLKERHHAALHSASQELAQNRFLLTLGGGHDYGYPDAAAFVDAHLKRKNKQPLVINFDAHLDVRPADQQHHSGTPFRRLIEKYNKQFKFIEVGIQPQCNSIHHLEWLKSQGGHILTIDQIETKGMLASLKKILAKTPKDTPLWISMDIDGFSQSEAPGCSQSWVRGFRLQDYLQTMRYLIQNFSLNGMGIYEVSPPLDVDSRTSKLAALLMYETLRGVATQKQTRSKQVQKKKRKYG